MTDLDEELRADGRTWRNRLDEPADLDRLVDAALHAQGSRRQRLLPALAAAAVAAAALATAALYLQLHRDAPPHLSAPVPPAGVPATVLVHGKPVPYAGQVPWEDAILDPADPHRVFVFADNDRIESPQFVCGVADRVVVTESADQVRVLVAGYATPLPPGNACTLGGLAPVRTVVTLDRPLGARQVTDVSTGRVHHVLDAATVPSVHHVPPTCTAMPLSWAEQVGVARRSYVSRGRSGCEVELQVGPARSVRAPTPARDGVTTCPPLQVGRKLAQCWYFHDRYRGTGYTLRWHATPATALRLDVATGVRGSLSRAQVSAIAASVR